MSPPSKTKQIKQLKETIAKLRNILQVIKNQDECVKYGRHINCIGLENITVEDTQYQARLADKLCPHCLARFAMGGKINE